MKKSRVFEWITFILFIVLSTLYMRSDIDKIMKEIWWVKSIYLVVLITFSLSIKTWIVELVKESSNKDTNPPS